MKLFSPLRALLTTLLFIIFAFANAQPKLTVDKASVDAGVIYSGDVYQVKWKIKNTGNAPLIIENVHTSCGCTSVKNPKTTLAPGESDNVEIKFNSAGFRGKVSKQVEITSNDPQHRLTTLTLTAEVTVELEPINGSQVVWLGSAPIGKEIKQNVLFKNTSNKPITINGYTTTGSDVRGPFEKITVQPFDTLSIPLTIVPSKVGYAEEKLTFKTDSKKQSLLPVSVTYAGFAAK